MLTGTCLGNHALRLRLCPPRRLLRGLQLVMRRGQRGPGGTRPAAGTGPASTSTALPSMRGRRCDGASVPAAHAAPNSGALAQRAPGCRGGWRGNSPPWNFDKVCIG